ncbi:dihydrofolate reductase family protein [uncultured Leifsonia sp.]|uniref:dihydrofolate reductase family protein n=1 Tax=uncultured Leifsonia sp. TaxID=340359 RepID=UPI0028D17A9E|nr:dihydrofolate reductase family protein [uncultured Leifsonia sp.]
MALLYTANTSLDGYTVDSSGSFDFTVPSEEVHAFINDRQRPIGTYLYGRRMYETMRVWQELPGDGDSEVVADYAGIWQAADKVVYSATLPEVGTPRTRLERVFEPDAVRALVDASDADVAVGGPTIAVAAFRAGLVAQVELFVSPVSVGGGLPALPLGVRLELALRDQRVFENGTVYLRYDVSPPAA